MTAALKQEIETRGYAVVEGLLDKDSIDEIIDDYSRLLDRLAAQWHAEGRLSSAFKHLPFEDRLTAILSESTENLYGYFDIALPKDHIAADTPIHLSRAVFNLLRHKAVLDKVEEVIGGEILASPIQHVRIKPAERKVAAHPNGLIHATTWHQDQGVTRANADDTDILTVWIAITDATVDNGCLQVVPYSHRHGITLHCPEAEVTIPRQLLAGEPLPVPVRAGDALFMHRLTQHASLPNRSDTIRWSFDLRYQPIGAPTGRDEFPSLAVRSRKNPAQMQNYDDWRSAWHDVRRRLAVQHEREPTHRWDGDVPTCA